MNVSGKGLNSSRKGAKTQRKLFITGARADFRICLPHEIHFYFIGVCCESENNNERVISLRDKRVTNPLERREKPLRSPRLCEIYTSLREIFLYLCN